MSGQPTYDLPAVQWLGRGIDMIALTPFDIDSVKGLIKSSLIIDYTKDDSSRIVTIGGVDYSLPRCIAASEDTGGIQSSYITYANGNQALNGFSTDPGAYGRLAVTANTNSYPLSKSFPSNYQFAFFNFNSDAYHTELREYIDFVNESLLEEKISTLPIPFTNNSESIAAYTTFFREVGSHVITRVSYGARANLSVWASNEYPDVNTNWTRDVTASVRGINNGGKYDESVFDEKQYKVFEVLVQKLMSVHGGNEVLAEALKQGQYDFDTLKAWAISASENPVLVTMRVTELWNLLRDTNSAVLQDSADSVEEAFKAITSQLNLQQTSTLVILEADSDLAEFGLLVPSSIVGVGGPLPNVDPAGPSPLGLSQTKVHWGSVEGRSVIIPFYIINDGSPIDFYITGGSGTVKASINGQTYETSADHTTERFYEVPVL